MDTDSNALLASPVLLAVPHAGRDYPARFATMVRQTATQLLPLEDRYADLLVAKAQSQGFSTLIARTPRCWIDLNRSPQEIDPLLTPLPAGISPGHGAKVRAGLGLVPRRLARLGDIWRAPVSYDDIQSRIDSVHTPWHACIEGLLVSARQAHGTAVLLDIHSMPSLAGHRPAQIVIGDLFGKSCSSRFARLAMLIAQDHGLTVAQNAPYAGGYTLRRHANPAQNVHALQIEIDRALYLDAAGNAPTEGLARVQNFVADLAVTIAEELRPPTAIAAE